MQSHRILALLLTASPALAFGGGHKPGPPLPPPPPPVPYTGPGDVVPHAPSPRTPATPPAPNSPSTGKGSGSKGAVPTGGASPSGPSGPATGTPYVPPGGAGVATGPAAAGGLEVTTWEYWWLYNKDAYVDLKAHIAAFVPSSGLDAQRDDAAQWQKACAAALPKVLAALNASDDHDVQLSSMIALARACDGELRARAADFAAACSKREADGNRLVAETAVLALGVLGHEPSVIELAGLLRDTESARRRFGGKSVPDRTRAFAAHALGLASARTTNVDARRYAQGALLDVLEKADELSPDLQAACALALGEIELPELGDAAPSRSASRADAHARPSALDGLIAVLATPRGPLYLRAHAPQALVNLARDPATRARVAAALLARLDDRAEKAEVLYGSIQALGRLADASDGPLDKRMRAGIEAMLEKGDLQARCFARMALADACTRGPDGANVERIRARLVEDVAKGSSRERPWNALALGVLEHARRAGGPAPDASAAVLVRALGDARSPEETGALAIACGLAGAKEAAPILLERLPRTKEPRTQGYVSLALGLLDAREAVEPLRALLVESRTCSEKLPQTAVALALLEDPKLVPDLLALLARGTSQSTLSAALAALGMVGDRRALEPVAGVLGDAQNSAFTRAAAIAAVGRICDRDALPWQHDVMAGLNYRAMTLTLSDDNHGGLLDLQ